MKVRIEFDCENDAFRGGDLLLEVERVLARAADKMGDLLHRESIGVRSSDEAPLRDSNGNTIGKVVMVWDEGADEDEAGPIPRWPRGSGEPSGDM